MCSRSSLKFRRKIDFRGIHEPNEKKYERIGADPIVYYSHAPVEKCRGCNHARENLGLMVQCRVYLYPEPKWESGKTCPMNTHIKKETKQEAKSLDPLKASKKKAKGKL